ncbi:class I SAM-dependent methyltransferase [Alienimonas chondri]|uniref:Ubiquinone/menaquinone biosynthesis C-methyltransferase UbiE n=1 Tax=Alienimonas chondri TaxID=2681879 RepID=A0ABX1VD80_9PLAN|nr:class I SAM-dependent methyltransferase [Alienimonas chondri]NNJ25371.1 Ubiquinone/menaquinone biosynthesis C-methyltransferase UbiE [Alienimonas chondri]
MAAPPESPDAEYAALAENYDRDWAEYNRATADRTLRVLRNRTSQPGRTLDVGCGTGVMLQDLAEHGANAVGLDRSAEMLAAARNRLRRTPLVRSDAAALPFPDETFDAAVTNSALHYADDPAACVRELARVVRPGGVVVWTDWDGGALTTRGVLLWLRITRRPLGRTLTASAMAEALGDAGLNDVRVERWRHGLLWGLATASGRKPG